MSTFLYTLRTHFEELLTRPEAEREVWLQTLAKSHPLHARALGGVLCVERDAARGPRSGLWRRLPVLLGVLALLVVSVLGWHYQQRASRVDSVAGALAWSGQLEQQGRLGEADQVLAEAQLRMVPGPPSALQFQQTALLAARRVRLLLALDRLSEASRQVGLGNRAAMQIGAYRHSRDIGAAMALGDRLAALRALIVMGNLREAAKVMEVVASE